jgi:predicted DNA binding CopG/RHH family protein
LFVVCTIRADIIRVVPARNMTRREKRSTSHMGKKRRFANEDEEREFWEDHDSADLVDWTKAHRVTLPDLKPSLKTISIRLPSFLIEEIKQLAHKRDVPYQSLIKLFLAERVKRELRDDAA